MGIFLAPGYPGIQRELAPWGEEMKLPSMGTGLRPGVGRFRGPGKEVRRWPEAPAFLPSLLGPR